MSEKPPLEYWEVWYPRAAATGLLVGRGALDPTPVLLLHAAPDVITVAVRSPDGRLIAEGRDLARTLQSPMCRLSREGERISREDIWPGPDDLGRPVLLPGGEVGILQSWWNPPDQMEWRWQLELYNSRR
jgi:hypothetical protein